MLSFFNFSGHPFQHDATNLDGIESYTSWSHTNVNNNTESGEEISVIGLYSKVC